MPLNLNKKINYYLSVFKSKAFKVNPFVILFRYISLLFLDIFKIKKIFKIKHNKINFIKLDIEGAEFEALQGSLNTLSFHHPNIFLECTDEQEFFKINELLKRFNYQSHVFINKKLTKLNNFKSYGNIFILK